MSKFDSRYLSCGAYISADDKYRWLLWREWRSPATHDIANWYYNTGIGLWFPKTCLFIMLNPSTADGAMDDPTILSCVAFAKVQKYERLEVVNLFAYRATSPKDLLALSSESDPIGLLKNKEYVKQAVLRAGVIICAWGSHGSHMGQDQRMLGWLHGFSLMKLGDKLTKNGQPKHPLYMKRNVGLTPL
jgi:hypothetical protein